MANNRLKTASQPPGPVINATLHLINIPPGDYEQIRQCLGFAQTLLAIYLAFNAQMHR